MSSSLDQFSSSSSFTIQLLQVDLNELNDAHKLSKWFTLLPKYRQCYLKSTNTLSTQKSKQKLSNNPNIKIDTNNCQLLSKFVYENQLSGKQIKYNFNESQFKSILDIIYNDKKYDYKQFKWIWDIIAISQSINTTNNTNDIFKTNKPKLHWISSAWDKFECIQYQNHDKLNQIESDMKEWEELKENKLQNGKYDSSIVYKSMENKLNKIEEQTKKTADDEVKSENMISISKQDDVYDAEFTSQTPTSDRDDCEDQLEHHQHMDKDQHTDDEYDANIAREEEHFLVNDDTPKQQHKKRKKGNRVRLNTDSSTMDSTSFTYNYMDGGKAKYNEKRKKVDEKIYQTVGENDDTTAEETETGGSSQEITMKKRDNNNKDDELPKGIKGGKCGCVIL